MLALLGVIGVSQRFFPGALCYRRYWSVGLDCAISGILI